ncbi:MAG: hypothetical protein K9N35_05065 [Candidatus Marinimicrobia bacterium]|nr:hypothetical protein [Candidatus Neomarinimicrobiota bacterium]
MCNSSLLKKIGIGFLILFGIMAFGVITMLLWNWLIPVIFNGPTITFIQALGLLVLSKILFSGGHGKHHDSRHSSRHVEWKDHLRKRMEQRQEEVEDDAPHSDI